MTLALGTLMSMGVLAGITILFLAIWSIVWKGFALWIAAKEKNKYWFIALLIFNTAGILEIIYLVFFSETGGKFLRDWRERRLLKKSTTKTTEKQKPSKKQKKNVEEKEV